jgi:DNA primase
MDVLQPTAELGSPVIESLDPGDRQKVIVHYDRVAPLIASAFGQIPLTTLFLPDGFDGDELRVGRLHKPAPPAIPTVQVQTLEGPFPFVALTAKSMLWEIHRGAFGFESWSPTPSDPSRVAFAHINVSARGKATRAMQLEAVKRVRHAMNQHGIDAFITLSGPGTILWIPFADAPTYPDFRTWAHRLFAELVAASPDLFESKLNTPQDRVRLSASSSAPGHGVGLPYSLRGVPSLPMNLPIAWDELDTLPWDAYDVDNAHERLAKGDVLAAEIARIGAQRFAPLAERAIAAAYDFDRVPESPQPRSEVITIALAILADGKPRLVEEIEEEAIARDLWPKNERRKYVYATLKAYIEKSIARNEKPLIVQDPDRRFRLNHPADDLPDPAPETPWQAPQKLINALVTTSTGVDPTAFELAVCNAFEALGFKSTHIGGTMNPDGYIDAILGPLGYRIMLECKSSGAPMHHPDIYEAGKFVATYNAQGALIIAPSYAGDKVIPDECKTHNVSAWTVADLTRALELGLTAYELRSAFAPGFAGEHIADLEWERSHGARKRLTVICNAIREVGWQAQTTAAGFASPTTAPMLTEDAALLLVDEHFRSIGAQHPCTREEVRDAFMYLTNPRVAEAVWFDDNRNAIVITKRI